MEQGFGAAKFLQVAKGAPLVAGWAHFSQSNNITDEILELNKDILDALLDVNHSGIWKKTQLASALEDLDRKVELGLTLTKGKGWADQAAMLIMQSFIYLRSKQNNCHIGARYLQWLNNMFGKMSKEGSMYNSPEQGSLALPLASTPQVPDSSANHMAKHAMLLAKAKGARKPKLMYRKSESPTKAMEATTATKLPPSSPQDATKFWYDWAQDCAAMMSKLGGKTVYSHKYCDLDNGTRMYIFSDGSTWTTAEYAQADDEEQEEEEQEEEEQ
jgi:hypothetical protein